MSVLNKKSNLSSFDIETIGMNPYIGARVFAFCIGWIIDNGENCDVDVYRLDNENESENKNNRQLLKEFFLDSEIEKICHNLKYELSFLSCEGYAIPENTVLHDTMIQSQLLRNLASSHALDAVCFDLCGYQKDTDKSVEVAAKAVGKNYSLIDKQLMGNYQICDGERTALIHSTLFPSIKKDPRLYACYLNEIELIKVTQRMEQRGMMIDRQNITEMEAWLENELSQVLSDSFALLGEYVNLNSDEQVGRILFRKYNFKSIALTESGEDSTDKDVISKMKLLYDNHPIFDLILKQRSYSNALSTLRSYLKFAGETDIIHANINTNRARTGRQSCSKPNLQNTRKEAALKNLFPVPLRRAFRAPPKHVVFLVDQSGIEMRLIIDATGEKELLDMLIKDVDADVHHPTVECFLGVDEARLLMENNKEEYKIQRNAFKNVGFGIAYGASDGKVAFTLAKSLKDIREGCARYRRRFQRIDKFTPNMIEQVRKKGYVETSFGRRLYIPQNKAYIGSNYLIQGTAAEILKRGEVAVDKFLRKETGDKMRMVMTIHDELIFSMSRELLPHRDSLLAEISRRMVIMPEIKVPLRVEWKCTTTSWADARKIKVKY